MTTVEVVRPGLLTTPQDLGRFGYAHLGIGRSGAFDLPALRIANALCGNANDACALEITLLGPTLRFHRDARVAVTGASLTVLLDGIERKMWSPLRVPANATLALGAMRTGCRAYLAVRGGFDFEPVLGSRSADINAALSPLDGRPLQAGDVLPVGHTETPQVTSDEALTWSVDNRPWHGADPALPLRLLPGTHFDILTGKSRKLLFSSQFKVQTDSNRTGVRLTGLHLEWTRPIEMVSEGCVPGLLQLPPSGQPIAFGVECPVSGGYPRIGQIAAVDLPRLAQLRPGDAVRFIRCTLADAMDALRERERALQKLETAVRRRLKMDSGFRHDETVAAPE